MRPDVGNARVKLVITLLIAVGALAYFAWLSRERMAPKPSVPADSTGNVTGQTQMDQAPIAPDISDDLSGPSVGEETPSREQTGLPSDAAGAVDELPQDIQDALKGPAPTLPEDLKRQLDAPPPELPEDLKRQLESPPPQLPDDLKAQLEAPPPELPEDIKRALATPPRVVSIEEVNTPPSGE